MLQILERLNLDPRDLFVFSHTPYCLYTCISNSNWFHLFHFAAYCVVAVEATGRQVPIAFLERVNEDFVKRYGGGKAMTATANSLNKEFGYISLLGITK